MEDILGKFETDDIERGQAAVEIQADIDERKVVIQSISNEIETLEDALTVIGRTHFNPIDMDLEGIEDDANS